MYVMACADYAVRYLHMFGSRYDKAYDLNETKVLFALNCLVACMLRPVLTICLVPSMIMPMF